MTKLRVNVDVISRWSYSDEDSDLVLERGLHELEDLSDAEAQAIKDAVASNVGLSLVDDDDVLVELATNNDGEHLVKGKDVCVACLGNGPTGSEGDFDRLGSEGGVCGLCDFDNSQHLEAMKSAPLAIPEERAAEPVPGESGRNPGEPVEDEA